jgi:hypothetical protein
MRISAYPYTNNHNCVLLLSSHLQAPELDQAKPTVATVRERNVQAWPEEQERVQS